LMTKNGEVMGVIRALCKEPRNFTPQEIDLFEQLANGAAIAIENERLYVDLEKSNKTKSEFLSMMSHELRTPLNIIMGYTALAREDMPSKGDEEPNTPLGMIEAQSRNLLDMINSMMEATQIESGAISVTKQRIDVGALFEQLQTAHDSPRQKDLVLRWQIANGLPTLVTDYEKLQHILKNLIGNAVKFTESGAVTVSAKLAESNEQSVTRRKSDSEPGAFGAQQFMELTVSDTGIGIPEASLPVIFDIFKQVDSSNTRPYEGLGLGLYIAKKYCEMLGGEISVKSELGKGSTFTVRIPCDREKGKWMSRV
jgi:signal transduction histidine kinase